MDPLSIAASVAGLIAAGGKLAAILTQICRLSDAPPLCKAVLTEVCDTAMALRQVQNFLNGQLYVPSERREYVLLEHVATALTGCVMTKDELETLLDGMGLIYAGNGTSIRGVFDRVKWVRKEQDIQRLVQRLQNHKASLNLILTIFQCSSSVQVQNSVDRLSNLVEEALLSHSELSIRLGRLEGDSSLRDSTIRDLTVNEDVGSIMEQEDQGNDDASVVTITRESEDNSENEDNFIPAPFEFDAELQGSRAYWRSQLLRSDGHSETSITTSIRRKAAASIFSALSLAEISNLSQYSLPIFMQEIGNQEWYIQVGKFAMNPGGMGPTALDLIFEIESFKGVKKTFSMQSSHTGRDLKVLTGHYPFNYAFIYEYSSSLSSPTKLFRIRDDKTFEEQGITAEQLQRGARVWTTLGFRAVGGEPRRAAIARLRGEFEFERFSGG